MSIMKILCIDVGNTSVHYGIAEKQTVTESGHFPTNPSQSKLSQIFREAFEHLFPKTDGISFCSVVPKFNEPLLNYLRLTNLPIFHLTHTNCKGLKLAYPRPEEIGQDRLANAIAAQTYYSVPAVIIDMGTAVTLDIISNAGYEGGIIAPGLEMMTRYLHEQTALLPKLDESDLLQVEGAIGKSTLHAMQLGVAVGFSGMLEALLKKVFAELKHRNSSKPIVLSTGGSTANLIRKWEQKSLFVKDLTLIGLAAIFEHTR